MPEILTLHSSNGSEITNCTIEFVRPRFAVLRWKGRTFVWDDQHQQYRETSCYEVPATKPPTPPKE